MPIALEIFSPEKLLLSRSVEMTVIPAAEGDMGILEGHTPMIVTLRGGAITLYEGDRVLEQHFVAGGFAEVTEERCTILANEAVLLVELSTHEGERRSIEAESKFAQMHGTDTQDQRMAFDRAPAARARVGAAKGLLTESR